MVEGGAVGELVRRNSARIGRHEGGRAGPCKNTWWSRGDGLLKVN